jgi:hypothetical protein
MTEHVCIRATYYLERLWHPGEIIEQTKGFEGAPPNKHFAPVGSVDLRKSADNRPRTAGDDPRTNLQMADELKAHGVEGVDDMSRKQMFLKLMAIERGEDDAVAKKEATKPAETNGAVDPPVEIEDPLSGVELSSMTPDEIEDANKDDFRTCLMVRYGVSMPARSTKPELVDRAMQEELRAIANQ